MSFSYVDKIPLEPFEWNDTGTASVAQDVTTVKDLVERRFNATLETAEEMLERLVGVDGNSGYLGALNSVIEDYI